MAELQASLIGYDGCDMHEISALLLVTEENEHLQRQPDGTYAAKTTAEY